VLKSRAVLLMLTCAAGGGIPGAHPVLGRQRPDRHRRRLQQGRRRRQTQGRSQQVSLLIESPGHNNSDYSYGIRLEHDKIFSIEAT